MGTGVGSNSHFGVLLVDDAEDLRLLVRTTLELSGKFEVVGEGEDGVEGVDLARQHRPDLVLLDISMPRRDGLEALPLIREASPESTVVMLTALEEDRYGKLALERGATAYLQKGLPSDWLVATLLDLLAGESLTP